MFDTGGLGAITADAAIWSLLSASATTENRASYRKVTAAGDLWECWIERDIHLGNGSIYDCGNNALAEIALRLGCSKTMAENYANVGMDLRLRLPLVGAAFAAGELDYARVARICRDTTGFRPDTVTAAEPAILAAARRMSPGPLGSEIDDILIRLSPDEVAARRRDAAALRRIRKRPDGDLCRVEVQLSAEEGEVVWQRVCEVADTVCSHDRRARQYRLVDAFMALIHGEDRLRCLCAREDCVATGKTAPRRAPLTQVTVDVATLLGLVSNPAYLAGHGPIDPELARQLAADGTWQLMLTEAFGRVSDRLCKELWMTLK